MSTDRVIVQRGAAEKLIPRLQEIFGKVKAGVGETKIGSEVRLAPLLNEPLAENVLAMMREAKENGAEVLAGDLTRQGAVVQPHILSGVKPGMRAWDQESFGPGARRSFCCVHFQWGLFNVHIEFDSDYGPRSRHS